MPEYTEDNGDQVLERILQAQSVSELEQPMIDLIQQARQARLLSELWAIVDVATDRVKSIRSLSDLGEGEDVPQNPREKIGNWFGALAESLARKGLHDAAKGLLVELWNELGLYQYELNQDAEILRHIFRAGVAMYLGRIFLTQDESGAAIWWLLHAHADDLVGQHSEGGGAARDMLRLVFGVDEAVFDYMERQARSNRESEQAHAWYAEHLVMQLSLKPEYAKLFAYSTSLVEFPIGSAYAATMLSRVEKNREGPPLEEFARYLIMLIAGWVPTRNLYHSRTRIESDLIARYVREPEAISSAHSRAILVECKNIKRPLGVPDTGYFLYRMYLTQVKVGILFARKNVSDQAGGEEAAEYKNAKHLLDLAFQRDSTVVIAIDLEDMMDLVNEEITIWSLINSRIAGRRFGESSD